MNQKKKILYYSHVNTGHTGYYRFYKEIIQKKYYLKNIIEDCKDLINKCPDCLKLRGGKQISLLPKSMITKGAEERYVADRWALHEDIKIVTEFCYVIDTIDYFSKFMTSIPIKENNAQNALLENKEILHIYWKSKNITDR